MLIMVCMCNIDELPASIRLLESGDQTKIHVDYGVYCVILMSCQPASGCWRVEIRRRFMLIMVCIV